MQAQPPQEAATAPTAAVEGTNLAFTGGDVLVLTGVGLGLLAVGGMTLAARRRVPAVA